MEQSHIPVLKEEVQHWMQAQSGKTYVDGTLGLGGHASMLLEDSAPNGVLLGIERDPRNLKTAQARLEVFGDRARLVRGNYADLKQILHENNIHRVDGVLLDVGFSSVHVDDPTRGFSFLKEGPLDMRYDLDQALTAELVVNSWSEADLADAFILYGEEKRAQPMANVIVRRRSVRPFHTTTDLAETIAAAFGKHGKVHPATRVFQALRIVVNDELGALRRVLPDIEEVLVPGGRLLVISFHSLEDRIVKRFIKASKTLRQTAKKPIAPSLEEIAGNPRARSAKLRVAEKNLD